jgi:hypothetical protein
MEYPALMAAYCIWKGQGLFGSIFYRTPGMTMLEFLSWNYRPTSEPVGCYVGDKLVGIGWICQARQVGHAVLAEVGAAFFAGTPESVWHRALDLFLEHAFTERGFAAIYGVSASENRAARLITQYCGMKLTDCLPWGEDVPADCVVTTLDKKTWQFNTFQGEAV